MWVFRGSGMAVVIETRGLLARYPVLRSGRVFIEGMPGSRLFSLISRSISTATAPHRPTHLAEEVYYLREHEAELATSIATHTLIQRRLGSFCVDQMARVTKAAEAYVAEV
jgi:hypothetical protein